MTTTSNDNAAQTSVTLELDAILNIESAMAFRDTLEELSEKCCNVVLNGRYVETIDTTALQLLLAFVRKVKSNGFKVRWEFPSPVVIGTTAMAGLDVELGV